MTCDNPKENTSESFELKQDDNNYKLNIKIINNDIIINILEKKEKLKEYEIKLTLEEFKQMHKAYSIISSCQEFVDYIKALIENKKLSIKKTTENQINIELIVDYLFKQNTIKIDLTQKNISLDLMVQDLYNKISIIKDNYKNLESNYKTIIEENKNIKEEIKNIKEENNKIKEENNKIKEENINIKNRVKNLEEIINKKKIIINSSIMEENEFDMIKSAIEQTMNKEIKGINKLYQATIEGGDPEIFHKKCDNIINTLILYKSEGKRRFGGFTSLCWKEEGGVILDKNSFLFSLDKKKIYYSKKDNYYEIVCYSYDGPSFSNKGVYIIEISENYLRTNEDGHYQHDLLFEGNANALSEDGKFKGIKAEEYEVFEIKF